MKGCATVRVCVLGRFGKPAQRVTPRRSTSPRAPRPGWPLHLGIAWGSSLLKIPLSSRRSSMALNARTTMSPAMYRACARARTAHGWSHTRACRGKQLAGNGND